MKTFTIVIANGKWLDDRMNTARQNSVVQNAPGACYLLRTSFEILWKNGAVSSALAGLGTAAALSGLVRGDVGLAELNAVCAAFNYLVGFGKALLRQ